MYTTDRIEKADPHECLTVTQVYKDFEVWFNMYNKGENVPPRSDARYHLIQHWGRVANNTWFGIKFREDEAKSNPLGFVSNALGTRPAQVTPEQTKKPQLILQSPAPVLPTQNGAKAGPKFVIEESSSQSLAGLDLGLPDIVQSEFKPSNVKVVLKDGKLVPLNIIDDIQLTTIPTGD